MTQAPPSALSASTLLYLFSDQIVGPARGIARFLPGATHAAPCSGVKVFTQEVAEEALAMGFWQLREQGLARLEERTRSWFVFSSRRVCVGARHPAETPGIEGELLRRAVAATAENDQDVRGLVYHWIGRDRPMPQKWVVNQLRQHGLAHGYLTLVDAERNPLASRVLGERKLEPDCDRIGRARPAFEELRARWQAFRATEPALYRALRRASRSGWQARSQARDVPL